MKKIVLKFCLIFIVILMSFSLTACDFLDAITGEDGFTPTSAQMVTALKEALTKGSSDTTDELSKAGGFYGSARQIPLPPEAANFVKNAAQIPGANKAVSDLLERINRAAEEASKSIFRIFGDAIMEMTFDDALTILKGKNSEATDYFREKTTGPLITEFSPILDLALEHDIVGNVSAQDAWGTLTKINNDFVNGTLTSYLAGQLGLKRINTDLSDFVLQKTLDAVWDELAKIEQQIREDPLKFVTNLFSDISANVFKWAKK